MSVGYCELCGVPLSEWDMCTYGDICMSCNDQIDEEANDVREQ